jgi:hypothetical protein
MCSHDIHTEDDNSFTWKYLQSCADAAWSKSAEYYNNHQLNWQNRFPEDTDLLPAYYAAQSSTHIESGHGLDKSGFFKATRRSRGGLITRS